MESTLPVCVISLAGIYASYKGWIMWLSDLLWADSNGIPGSYSNGIPCSRSPDNEAVEVQEEIIQAHNSEPENKLTEYREGYSLINEEDMNPIEALRETVGPDHVDDETETDDERDDSDEIYSHDDDSDDSDNVDEIYSDDVIDPDDYDISSGNEEVEIDKPAVQDLEKGEISKEDFICLEKMDPEK